VTTRVSVSSTGAQATGGGSFALGHRAISGDGNVAAFATDDGGLVAGDTGGLFDVFIMAVP
jgi:hypothetical protein